ncbi:MAG: GntR family transcriptional regulator [Eubacteriales bacterium]
MFSLDYRDGRPIYVQVKESLYHLMLSGALQQNDQLPSVRSLATSLAINPNTISRAYEALEKENLIYTVQGKGSFVAPINHLTQQRSTQLLEEFDTLVEELVRLGIGKDLLTKRLQEKQVTQPKEEEETP